jgi:hypothetical protein
MKIKILNNNFKKINLKTWFKFKIMVLKYKNNSRIKIHRIHNLILKIVLQIIRHSKEAEVFKEDEVSKEFLMVQEVVLIHNHSEIIKLLPFNNLNQLTCLKNLNKLKKLPMLLLIFRLIRIPKQIKILILIRDFIIKDFNKTKLIMNRQIKIEKF